MTSVHTETITGANGEPVVVQYQTPSAGREPHAAVLLVPAMAVEARFYTPVADWLVARGFAVYRFDYQGYGASARGPLTEVTADILTWAHDAAAVVDWVSEHAGDLPLTWIGHSLGGQLLPFVDHSRLARAIIVASGTGYWKNSEGVNRVLAPALWFAIAPTLVRALGYYPGSAIKVLGDLPPQVMRQWAHWCKHPDYLVGALPEHRDTFARVSLPLTSISFTDDRTMSATATRHLESFYTGADLTALRYSPRDLGVAKIDHFGFFRRGNTSLWEKVLAPEWSLASQ